MRFIYADPGLATLAGHHFTVCRNIVGALRKRGIATSVAAAAAAQADILAALDAKPLFRHWTYNLTDGDPISGWLNAFHDGAALTRADFAGLEPLSRDDVVYCASGQAAQVLGLVEWLSALPQERRPAVLMEMMHTTGIETAAKDGKTRMTLPDPRTDARGLLYRFVGHRMKSLDVSRLRFVSMNRGLVEMYSLLLQKPVSSVGTMPFGAERAVASRAGRRPITLAILGYQWKGKGYAFVPEVLAGLLEGNPQLRILVHNGGGADGTEDSQRALLALADKTGRVTVKNEVVTPEGWQDMLATIDLILCPYDPAFYRNNTSGVLTEAIANGIPVVVPAATTLEEDLRAFGGGGTGFSAYTAPAILQATQQALDRFDELAEAAVRGARLWAETEGPDKYADGLLRAARETAG